jgi:hypothetical protein
MHKYRLETNQQEEQHMKACQWLVRGDRPTSEEHSSLLV